MDLKDPCVAHPPVLKLTMTYFAGHEERHHQEDCAVPVDRQKTCHSRRRCNNCTLKRKCSKRARDARRKRRHQKSVLCNYDAQIVIKSDNVGVFER